MKLPKKNVLLAVMLGILLFSVPLTTQGFITQTLKINILMNKVHEPEWEVSYSFLTDCPEAFKRKEKEVEKLITQSLRVWLQPLRELRPEKQFTDKFIFTRSPDVAACFDDVVGEKFDVQVTFDCTVGRSMANILVKRSPDTCIKRGHVIGEGMTFALVHELGHAFGLGDTYLRGKAQSTGGLATTEGRQPRSIMSGNLRDPVHKKLPYIREDDRNGIIWLYKYLHEDHPEGDCFFPGYVHVEATGGRRACEPRYPLIFQAKHGIESSVGWVLRDDPAIDINARDNWGNTALHYAVQRGSNAMVNALLAHADIKVNLANNSRRTPLQLARDLKLPNIAKWIAAHPTAKLPPVAWDVAPGREKLTTMWAQLKQRN